MSSSPASPIRSHALASIPLGSPAASAKPDLYLEAVRSRTVVYDGSMGATILNMQLTPEDYGGKEGFKILLDRDAANIEHDRARQIGE